MVVGVGTAVGIGVTVLLGVVMVGTTVYSVRASQKMTERSLSESSRQRELSRESLKFSRESLEASRAQHRTNVVIGIIGILVSLATIGFALWQFKKRGAST